MKRPIPTVALILALCTLLASLSVSVAAAGSPFLKVPVLRLLDYGGVNNAQLMSGEVWRLLTAQFVHVRPAHMLFNVAMLFLLAAAIEQVAGPLNLLVIWGISGIVGTYASIYSVPPPYDVGSGASQAIAGLAGASLILLRRNPGSPLLLKVATLLTLVATAAVDLAFSGRVKPGHVVGFLVGIALGACVIPPRKK